MVNFKWVGTTHGGKRFHVSAFTSAGNPHTLFFTIDKQLFKTKRLGYHKRLAGLISHESIHDVLYRLEGDAVSHGLDALVSNVVRKYFGRKSRMSMFYKGL